MMSMDESSVVILSMTEYSLERVIKLESPMPMDTDLGTFVQTQFIRP